MTCGLFSLFTDDDDGVVTSVITFADDTSAGDCQSVLQRTASTYTLEKQPTEIIMTDVLNPEPEPLIINGKSNADYRHPVCKQLELLPLHAN